MIIINHFSLLALGPELFQKHEENNFKRFEEKLHENEGKISNIFNKEREEALRMAKKKYSEIYKRLEEDMKYTAVRCV